MNQMTERKTIYVTCISCPLGCAVEVHQKGDEIELVGNRCKKGEEYVRQELTNPMRSITTTVRTSFHDFPRLSVKTDGEIPLKDIYLFMEEINTVEVSERLKPGAVVKAHLRGSEVNLVATCDMSVVE